MKVLMPKKKSAWVKTEATKRVQHPRKGHAYYSESIEKSPNVVEGVPGKQEVQVGEGILINLPRFVDEDYSISGGGT